MIMQALTTTTPDRVEARVLVKVLHNAHQDEHGRNLGMLDGYSPGDPLIHVADIHATPTGGDVNVMFDEVYRILNVGDDPSFGAVNEEAVAYRARRNRSLSMGDVLVVDGVAYSVDSFGFECVTVDPAQISDTTSIYGSTGVSAAPAA